MLRIDERLLEFDVLVDELVDELLSSEETDNYRKRRIDFVGDADLQEELMTLNENLEWVNYRPELRELKKEIILNEKVYQLRLAENDLQELLSSITKSLVQELSVHVPIDENLVLRGGNHHQRRKFESF